MDAPPAASCPFFDLPTELRLIIYGYALTESPIITIGCAELVGDHPDIIQRLYTSDRTPYPGIPPNNEPIVETRYEPSLLSLVQPATIPLDPDMSMEPDEVFEDPHVARQSLLLINKRVCEEVRTHFLHTGKSRQTSLFMQYPYGLHIMRTSAPNLLHQARTIHLAGTYRPQGFCPQRAAYFGPLVIQNPAQDYSPIQRVSSNSFSSTANNRGGAAALATTTSPSPLEDKPPRIRASTRDSTAQLAGLVKGILGGDATARTHPGVEALEMRIYYPDEDSYSTVWGDDASPTLVALRNIGIAHIALEVWRGRQGTGIHLRARPSPDGQRVVSTVWRRLDEGRPREPPCGSWVVDPEWPDGKEWGALEEEDGA